MSSPRVFGLPLPAAIALGLLVLVGLAHGASLRNGFVYDDHWTLLGNPVVRDPGQFWSLWGAKLARADIPDAGRPLMLASEMLDWSLWGARPAGPHLQNLLWHAGVVLMLFLLLSRLTGSLALAAAAAGLVGVHPLNVEVVAAINYREDLLAAFFVLCALGAIGAARQEGGARLGFRAAAVLATLAAGFSKENGILIPLVLVVVDVFTGPPADLRRRLPDYLTLTVAAAVPFVWRWWVLGQAALVSHTAELPHGHLDRLATVPLAALSFVQGLGQFLVPVGLSPEYADPSRDRAVAILGWICLALLLLTVAAALAARRPQFWLGLGFTAAVAVYLPHLGLIPLTNLRADRYFYLPSLGLALAAVAGLDWAVQRLGGGTPVIQRARQDPRVLAAGALLVGALLCVGSARQGRIWRSERTVFAAATEAAPDSSRAWLGLANAELQAGNTMAALQATLRAQLLDRGGHARELRGLVAMKQGDLPRARLELVAALASAAPAHRARVLNNLGYVELGLGLRAEARGHLAQARALAPWFDRPWLNEARSQLDAGDPAGARATLEALVARIPQSIDGWKLLGSLLERQQQLEDARRAYRRAAELDRSDAQVARALTRLR